MEPKLKIVWSLLSTAALSLFFKWISADFGELDETLFVENRFYSINK